MITERTELLFIDELVNETMARDQMKLIPQCARRILLPGSEA